MISQVISKRTSVLMALLLLAVGLLVISGNSAYADNLDDPVTLTFTDDFGGAPAKQDVPNWSEIEEFDADCATKNYRGDFFLNLRNGCDAYVTILMDPTEFDAASSLFLTYDWGQHITSKSGNLGDLSVYLTVSGTDINGVAAGGRVDVITYGFEPQVKIGPINHVSNHVEWGLGFEQLAGRPYILEVHFVGTSEGKNDWALVDNVILRNRDAQPRGTYTAGQGRRGSSIDGEPITCEVLTTMNTDSLAEMNVDAISAITAILASASVNVDIAVLDLENITTARDVTHLCLFLIGEEGNEGGNNDCGFLPAGKVDCRPVSNLAAQDITLRINLNLGGIWGTWGDEGVEFRPIELGYYLNIDPVPDPNGVMVYPVDNYDGDELLGTCGAEGATVEGLCAAGENAGMEALGIVVQRLDRAGTTVGDMLDAADTLLMAGATVTTMHTINGVELTQLQVTDILSMINKSYKGGIPTGVVTAWDYN